eukprot:1487681-Prymnesium_polylepis.1
MTPGSGRAPRLRANRKRKGASCAIGCGVGSAHRSSADRGNFPGLARACEQKPRRSVRSPLHPV